MSKLYDGKIIQIMVAPRPVYAVYATNETDVERLFCDVMFLTEDGYVGYLNTESDYGTYIDCPADCSNFLGYEFKNAPIDWTEKLKLHNKRKERNAPQ